jgi:hypothetical protein
LARCVISRSPLHTKLIAIDFSVDSEEFWYVVSHLDAPREKAREEAARKAGKVDRHQVDTIGAQALDFDADYGTWAD